MTTEHINDINERRAARRANVRANRPVAHLLGLPEDAFVNIEEMSALTKMSVEALQMQRQRGKRPREDMPSARRRAAAAIFFASISPAPGCSGTRWNTSIRPAAARSAIPTFPTSRRGRSIGPCRSAPPRRSKRRRPPGHGCCSEFWTKASCGWVIIPLSISKKAWYF